ncbi:MAG: glycosyltransferase [Micromonosporaceae bacterium]
MDVSIVIPTLGRTSLRALLDALAAQAPPAGLPEIIVVDDRPQPITPLDTGPHAKVVNGRGAGPAAARNTGARAAGGDWVAFLDDDVVPTANWLAALRRDLAAAGADVGGVQGRLEVPLPAHRRPTDWERATAGLAEARWTTADMAYRRAALDAVGGFDEGFPRAYREDADLAYRVRLAGWRLVVGQRRTAHPVRPESRWVSLRNQRGNADDARLRRRYGRRWRTLLEVRRGRRHRHAVIAAAGLAALAAPVLPVPGARLLGAVAAAVWAAGTAEFALARIRPGPRTPDEILTMAVTSVFIPPLAVGHWLRGYLGRDRS